MFVWYIELEHGKWRPSEQCTSHLELLSEPQEMAPLHTDKKYLFELCKNICLLTQNISGLKPGIFLW